MRSIILLVNGYPDHMGTQELSLDPTERVHLADILLSEDCSNQVAGRGFWVSPFGEGWMCSAGWERVECIVCDPKPRLLQING